jgi:hypothetical protein
MFFDSKLAKMAKYDARLGVDYLQIVTVKPKNVLPQRGMSSLAKAVGKEIRDEGRRQTKLVHGP